MTREQFITHVEATRGALMRFLVALCCGDSALADDIAQEAYMKAYVALPTIRDDSRFKAWLFRTAYNTFLNNKRRSTVVAAPYEAALEVAGGEGADAGFAYQDLYAALNLLTDVERTSVLLYYMEDYPVREIAEMQQTTPEAVRQHLSRGRRHLRSLLTPQ